MTSVNMSFFSPNSILIPQKNILKSNQNQWICDGFQSAWNLLSLFHTKESHLSLKDRQKSRSLVGVETEPKASCVSSRTCPTVLLEDLKPSCAAPTSISHPDTTPATVIGYGPFFLKSPINPYVVEQSVHDCMDVSRKHGEEYAIITCDQAIYEVVLGLQKRTKRSMPNLSCAWVASILLRISLEPLGI